MFISFLGYEILETNLLAIAKLRPQLHRFNVCADCVMSLQYGHAPLNRPCVTKDEAFIQYGTCTATIRSIVSEVTCEEVVNDVDRVHFSTLDRTSARLAMASAHEARASRGRLRIRCAIRTVVHRTDPQQC